GLEWELGPSDQPPGLSWHGRHGGGGARPGGPRRVGGRGRLRAPLPRPRRHRRAPQGVPVPHHLVGGHEALQRRPGAERLRRHGGLPGAAEGHDAARAQPRALPERRDLRRQRAGGGHQPLRQNPARRHDRHLGGQPEPEGLKRLRHLVGAEHQLRGRGDALGDLAHLRGDQGGRGRGPRLRLRGEPEESSERPLQDPDHGHGTLLARGGRHRPRDRHRLPHRGRPERQRQRRGPGGGRGVELPLPLHPGQQERATRRAAGRRQAPGDGHRRGAGGLRRRPLRARAAHRGGLGRHSQPGRRARAGAGGAERREVQPAGGRVLQGRGVLVRRHRRRRGPAGPDLPLLPQVQHARALLRGERPREDRERRQHNDHALGRPVVRRGRDPGSARRRPQPRHGRDAGGPGLQVRPQRPGRLRVRRPHLLPRRQDVLRKHTEPRHNARHLGPVPLPRLLPPGADVRRRPARRARPARLRRARRGGQQVRHGHPRSRGPRPPRRPAGL
ncbi:MAG: hypothetical protein AVDCRST_MAG05-2800, partial [uncultured Rubrobacteraceae bacterium]